MPAELATSLTVTEADRLLQAEALVRAYCGWHIAPSRADVSFVSTGDYSNAFLLPSLYVTAVDSVTLDGTITASDTYDWRPNGVIISRGEVWSSRVIEVVFTHGYAAPPAEVTAVVQAIAQRAIGNPSSLARESAGAFSATYANPAALSLLADEKAILDRYRLPSRP